jgi:hypothetical protein
VYDTAPAGGLASTAVDARRDVEAALGPLP